MATPALYFNGINGETGDYLSPPATPEQIVAVARGDSISSESRVDMECWLRQGGRGLRTGDPRDLSQAGWGVIFAQNDDRADAILTALDELLTLRKSQIGEELEHRYQEYVGDSGFQAGDTKRRFLSRHGVGPGSADPDRMPYYLLIVGDPEMIPWEFQYELDIQYAVGRIWFETVEEYQRYAQNVVAAETVPRVRAKSVAVFAPLHPGDTATELSAEQLAAPLAERITKTGKGWTVRSALGKAATKEALQEILGGKGLTDLLFTAGHGLWFPSGHRLQLSQMGSLVCQNWPGPVGWHGLIPSEYYYGADDVNGADLTGLVSFHFACYSAGGPAVGDFKIAPLPAAPHAFVSRLPQRLLQAGALAVIGHVESAWQCSIEWPGAGRHIEVFEDFVDRLLSGHPVGSAMGPFGVRYAELSSELGSVLEKMLRRQAADNDLLVELWTNSHDARNYVVLGDPAVRLVPPEGAP